MTDATVQRHRRSRGEAGAQLGSAETLENRPKRSFRHESPREYFHAEGEATAPGAGPEVSVGRQRPDASSRSWKAVRYVAVGGPNQVVSASGSPGWVRSSTQPTYPSGRINTAVGAVTSPSTGSSHGPTYLASII